MTEESDDTTKSASTRWKFTNDVLVAVILFATAAFIYTGVALPVVWKALVALGGVWLFGPKSVEAVNKLRGK